MFKIKIEEEFNPKSDMVGKWFVKYDSATDSPIFTDNEEEGGIFVIDLTKDNDLFGNLMALSDRFNYQGTLVPDKI